MEGRDSHTNVRTVWYVSLRPRWNPSSGRSNEPSMSSVRMCGSSGLANESERGTVPASSD